MCGAETTWAARSRRRSNSTSTLSSLAKTIPEGVPLDLGLDFVVHDDGAIELTETGFRRMARVHSAGLDVVIGVDGRDVLRFPAPIGVLADARPRGGEKSKR